MSETDIQALEDFIIDFNLSQAIEDLSEREKKLIYMRFVEGKKDPSIGDELGVFSQAISKMRRKILRKIADNYPSKN
ncbi:sigma factor-like helix-turn-helix DNA-binding protein [Enterococcus hulanensis]|uniref:sigma factor-like helix-turn-helix DNA-binding protein n=1 Tax=Enterococcus hulanensis TaxID=2559929 RepID=UPI00289114E2|nr:sigma factor-like helix-turn-helix DNA-binding protein [Enterococcus hulanensis]MDT2661120.1 sigma factor-like helix-turn-helix DNA-binding protein [Enterococcus hulanensis]